MLAADDLLGQGPVIGVFVLGIKPLAGEQLVKDRSGGVNIRAVIDLAAAQELLGSHVAELAEADLRIGDGRLHHALGDAEVGA